MSGPSTRSKFIKFPLEWAFQLARAKADGSTYRVALYLLQETWRSGCNRVKLANGTLKAQGVSRWAKYRALDELGRLGLVSTEREDRRSPLVTVKFSD
jgi:hypothetical protein